MGNGLNTRFWEDLWIGNSPFSIRFARLYNLACKPGITVAKVFSDGWGGVRFRRTLSGETDEMWKEIQLTCRDVSLSDNRDKCSWLLSSSGKFSVKSLYTAIKINQSGCPFKKLWFIKVPAKIKVFLWLVTKRSILTRDVLKNRGWEGCTKCPFCSNEESIDHIFIHCPLARYIWSVVECAFDIKTDFRTVEDIVGWVFSLSWKNKKCHFCRSSGYFVVYLENS